MGRLTGKSPGRADSISHYISPVASAWDINRQSSQDTEDPLDAVMSGFALAGNADDQFSMAEKPSRGDLEQRAQTAAIEGPSIAMMERKYRWPYFLYYFKEREREREYERWYWKRNRRSWIRSIWYMLIATLCYYVQILVVSPIQAQSYRDKKALDPNVCIYGILFRNVLLSPDVAISSAQSVIFAYMILCLVLSVHLMSQFEASERRAFAINLGLVRNNDKLRHQLNHLQKKFKHKVNDLDSPLEKALWTLKSLLANPNLDLITHDQIDAIIQWLSASENLFTPIFDHQLNNDERMSLDDEQEKWLLDLLPAQQRKDEYKKRRIRTESENLTIGQANIPGSIIVQDDHKVTVGDLDASQRPLSAKSSSPQQPDASALSAANFTSPRHNNHISTVRLSLSVLSPVSGSANSLSTISLGKDNSHEHRDSASTVNDKSSDPGKEQGHPTAIHILLSNESSTLITPPANANSTSSPMTESHRIAIQALLSEAGLVGKFSIPIDKLRHFLLRIESGYHADVPYHNSTHACDVLHAINYFVNTNALQGRLTDIEILGAYLSAIIHDYDHPGFNNQFLISTRHTKAIFYNDRSVLENHHLASAWGIVMKDESNILCNLNKDEYKIVREQCVDMVLATDLSGHFAMLSAFKNKVLAAGTFDLDNRDDRSLFWRILIKCADVSNLTKEWHIYEKWLERIMAEFFKQGDDEKKLGLVVSPFMDRDTVQIASSQISFLDFICLPMYETFTRVAQIPEILENLARNRETLVGMREKDKKVITVK
ncbi:cAMP-specific 3',5'-cyclic phosphodiesterase 4A [Dinochytrium kinnereticum]|nr:cAMP-specific 3',5'-cyclic phosphodiesterase 4A [Dinochytrium kinnereticum]